MHTRTFKPQGRNMLLHSVHFSLVADYLVRYVGTGLWSEAAQRIPCCMYVMVCDRDTESWAWQQGFLLPTLSQSCLKTSNSMGWRESKTRP